MSDNNNFETRGQGGRVLDQTPKATNESGARTVTTSSAPVAPPPPAK